MTEIGRRDLLLWLTGSCLAASGGLALAPVAAYVWGPGRALGGGAGGNGPWRVGPVDDIAVGAGRVVETPRGPVLVVRTAKDALTALDAVCTHLGCLVRWDAEKASVLCPCHAARFGLDGVPASGPATAPLATWRAVIVEGEIELAVAAAPNADGSRG